MEIREPAVLELVQGKRTVTLRWETREEGVAIIEAILRRNDQLPGDGHPRMALVTVDGDGVVQDGEDDDEPRYVTPPAPGPGRCGYRGCVRHVSADGTHGGEPHVNAEGIPFDERPDPAAPDFARAEQLAREEPADDGPEPCYAESGPQCSAYSSDDENGWYCNSQRGHGGDIHVTWAASGVVAHTWPREPEGLPVDTVIRRLNPVRGDAPKGA